MGFGWSYINNEINISDPVRIEVVQIAVTQINFLIDALYLVLFFPFFFFDGPVSVPAE